MEEVKLYIQQLRQACDIALYWNTQVNSSALPCRRHVEVGVSSHRLMDNCAGQVHELERLDMQVLELPKRRQQHGSQGPNLHEFNWRAVVVLLLSLVSLVSLVLLLTLLMLVLLELLELLLLLLLSLLLLLLELWVLLVLLLVLVLVSLL